MKTAVAIRHVAFEDAGLLAPALERAGYALTYLEAFRDDLAPANGADLLVVLGGPIGAYEEATYPFLVDELSLIEQRLAADRPTIGFCLGSQLMARALGAPVYPGGTQEVGFGPLALTDAGRAGVLAPVEGVPVLHWHGDTFDLPYGCDLLASTQLYRHQGFSRGRNVLGLQFHIEVTARDFEAWLIGNACQLANLGRDAVALRAEAALHSRDIERAASQVFDRWLAGLEG